MGLLEKRMMERAKISKHHDFAYVIKTASMLNVVEEMRKEFPIYKNIRKENMTGEEIICALRDYAVACREWFEKWLKAEPLLTVEKVEEK